MAQIDWDDGSTDQWWPARPVRSRLSIPSPWGLALAEIRAFLRVAFLRRTRRDLMELTDEQLQDIGVTREAARREARRSLHIR